MKITQGVREYVEMGMQEKSVEFVTKCGEIYSKLPKTFQSTVVAHLARMASVFLRLFPPRFFALCRGMDFPCVFVVGPINFMGVKRIPLGDERRLVAKKNSGDCG